MFYMCQYNLNFLCQFMMNGMGDHSFFLSLLQSFKNSKLPVIFPREYFLTVCSLTVEGRGGLIGSAQLRLVAGPTNKKMPLFHMTIKKIMTDRPIVENFEQRCLVYSTPITIIIDMWKRMASFFLFGKPLVPTLRSQPLVCSDVLTQSH